MTVLRAPLALVTGGVRRLGARIAEGLARAGYVLALHSHGDPVPDEQLTAVLAETGAGWRGFKQDFAQADAADALLKAVVEEFDRTPDLIVCNAAIFGQDDALSMDQRALDEHLRINLAGPVLLTTTLAKLLPPDQQGCVIHILDQRIRNPHGDQLAYTLSKQALAEAVRTLANATAPRLRVNGIAPGLTIPTEDYDAAQLADLAAAMPLGRLVEPEDIADAVRFLAGAKNITGHTIFVDAGAHLRSYDRDFMHIKK